MINGNLMTSFNCIKRGLTISHLFFVDDILVFSRASSIDCETICSILKTKVKASNQLINYNKSSLCGSRPVPKSEGIRLANIVGMQFVDYHEKYLGLPSFTGRDKKKLFVAVKRRIWEQVKGW